MKVGYEDEVTKIRCVFESEPYRFKMVIESISGSQPRKSSPSRDARGEAPRWMDRDIAFKFR
jgi:hypothetical protein